MDEDMRGLKSTNRWLQNSHGDVKYSIENGVAEEYMHTTQACALTGIRTGDLSVCRLALNPLSHTSQSLFVFLNPLTSSPILPFPTPIWQPSGN